jgi:hypothetical protein
MVDRSEIQVLTGVNRHHDYTLGIREGSADGGTKGYQLHCTLYFLHHSSYGFPMNASATGCDEHLESWLSIAIPPWIRVALSDTRAFGGKSYLPVAFQA